MCIYCTKWVLWQQMKQRGRGLPIFWPKTPLIATLFHRHYSYRLSPEVSGDKTSQDNLLTWKQICTWQTAGSVLQLMRHLSKQLQPATAGRNSEESYKDHHWQRKIYDFNRYLLNRYLLNTVKQRGIYSFISGKNNSKKNTSSLIPSLCETKLTLSGLK